MIYGASMNAPRDHHFIPAFYLKQWAGPNGKLVEYPQERQPYLEARWSAIDGL
jgi:hypothetical protein